jgi:two-component system phosphate regulon sensor histidine kinase PhoR
LSIVKHIVERHRGRLSIESKLGNGTTVHVLLPVAVS